MLQSKQKIKKIPLTFKTMLHYRDLQRHEAKFRLHPTKQMKDMHGFADPILEKYAARERYLNRPKPTKVREEVLRLPTSAPQTSTERPRQVVSAPSLSGLGPRIKQIRFLADHNLFPPEDELNLDTWVANRLRELRQFMPKGTTPTIQNWVQLPSGSRGRTLDNEENVGKVVARERATIDQDREDGILRLQQTLSESAVPKLLLKKKKEAKTREDKINRAAANEMIFRVLPPRAARTEANRKLFEQSPVGKARARDDSTFEPGDASDVAFNVRFPGLKESPF